jgi:protein TonB
MTKKNPEVDLRLRYKKTFELGLIFALAFVIFFLFFLRDFQIEVKETKADVPEIKVEDIPQTEQIKRPPPPPRPAVAVPSESEDIPDDETIESTELDLSELPPPPPPPKEDDAAAGIFVAYDEAPEPIGGFAAIQRNLKYPEIARKAGIEGTVYVEAVIDEKGNVVQTAIVKSLGHSGCDEAAIAAIRSVKWKPAKQRDKAVKVRISIPVKFRLK